MHPLPIDSHPARFALVDELHARPFPQMQAPSRAAYLAIRPQGGAAVRDRDAEFAHLLELLDRFGAARPAPGAGHYFGRVGDVYLKWESHTEFVTYTLFAQGVSEPPFSGETFALFPAEWLVRAPGRVLVSCLVRVDLFDPASGQDRIEPRVLSSLVDESLAMCRVPDGNAVVASDFRLDANGHSRIALRVHPEIGARRLGRLVQRMLELHTYTVMALLALPEARRVSDAVLRLDAQLSALVAHMASERGHADETLDALLQIAAGIEALASASAFRFGAAEAYEAIVRQRLDVLHEERVDGRQLFTEFMLRRFDPAMRTCRSAKQRLDELSMRASRAAHLLRTRIDVARQADSHQLLAQMDRRAALQLRLQETVEGLSVVAISYSALSLLGGLLQPMAGWLELDKPVLTALLTVPTIALVWWLVRRVRHRLGSSPGA